MKRRILIAAVAVVTALQTINVYAWGPKGHDVVAYIAWCNMTENARERVTEVLEGTSMVYWSSWMDNIRDLPAYAHTSTWHYANVDEGYTYETMPKNENGDVVTALDMVINQIWKGHLDKESENTYLKFLIHMMGDLHCPMHAGRLSDLGGNLLKIEWFGTPTSLHSIWDSHFIESVRKWSYTEWRENIDYVPVEAKFKMQEGSVLDWFNETVEICAGLYDYVTPGENYSYKYMFDNYPLLELQLQRGGYRLAKVLNQLYD